MNTPNLPLSEAPRATARGYALLLAAYGVAIFLSAALLFAVQPMFTKMVLPRLGGAPSVWSVAMVFFQAALLAGYAYAHLLTRYAPGEWPSSSISRVMVGAVFTLPLVDRHGLGPPAGRSARRSGCSACSRSRSGCRSSRSPPTRRCCRPGSRAPIIRPASDPYFLYAASNVGSFLALLSYPVADRAVRAARRPDPAVVRRFHRSDRADRRLRRAALALAGDSFRTPRTRTRQTRAPPTWRDAATWVALAAVPSGLLIAVTAHISTDVAAVPLLWVLPLALYLVDLRHRVSDAGRSFRTGWWSMSSRCSSSACSPWSSSSRSRPSSG